MRTKNCKVTMTRPENKQSVSQWSAYAASLLLADWLAVMESMRKAREIDAALAELEGKGK